VRKPVVTSVEMGYGHLRAAHALASELGTEILHVDRPPLVAPEELRLWRASRRIYEATSRAAAAWYGFLRMPKLGLYRILETVAGGQALKYTGPDTAAQPP
jgi:hypothetical protein